MTIAMTARKDTQGKITRAQNGDRQAFDDLIAECQSALEGHTRRRVGSYLRTWVELEDVLQETYTRAWKSISGFRGTDANALLRWLKGITEHVVVDFASQHRRDEVIYVQERHDPVHPQPSPSQALRRGERFTRLQKALDNLSPEHREVVTLVRIEGLKIREAADRMSRSPNAVMKLLTRALKELKDRFGDTESLHLPPERLDGRGYSRDD